MTSGIIMAALLPMAAVAEVVSDWHGVVLRVGDRELKPLAVPSPPLWGKRFDEGWADLSKDDSIQVRSDTGEVLRTIKLPAGRMAAGTPDGRIVAVYPDPAPKGGLQLVGWISEPGKIGPGRLRVLRPDGDANWDLLGAAVVAGREGFLLGKRRSGDRQSYEKILLQAFSGEGGESILSWEQALAGGEVSLPGAFLWASRVPRLATPGLLPLVPCGDTFLVTPGPQEAIYCIDPAKPDMPVRWKLEKPWEFRRGFIGPSVWSHYLSRFGIQSLDQNGPGTIDWKGFVAREIKGVARDYREEYRKRAEADMARFKKVEVDLQQRCQMSGGPFVLTSEGRSNPTFFIAIAESEESGPWARYLAHTILYEIEAGEGTPKAMIRLPRNPLGSEARVMNGALLWRCDENGLACLEPSGKGGFHFGPGGPDCIGRLKWYSEETPRRHDAWLSSPATGSAFTWTDSGMIMALDDSWIEKKGEKLFHLPFREFRPGWEPADYELIVPLSKSPEAPESNYSSSNGKIRTTGSYLLGITAIGTWDKRLYMTLGFGDGYQTMVFDEALSNQPADKPDSGQPATRPK